jgi:hypothetical protein
MEPMKLKSYEAAQIYDPEKCHKINKSLRRRIFVLER